MVQVCLSSGVQLHLAAQHKGESLQLGLDLCLQHCHAANSFKMAFLTAEKFNYWIVVLCAPPRVHSFISFIHSKRVLDRLSRPS